MPQLGSRLLKWGLSFNFTGFSLFKSCIIFLHIQRVQLQPGDTFFYWGGWGGGSGRCGERCGKGQKIGHKINSINFLLFCSMVPFEINWDERNVSTLKRAGLLTFSKWDVFICLLETSFSLSISFQRRLRRLCFLDLSSKISSFFQALVYSYWDVLFCLQAFLNIIQRGKMLLNMHKDLAFHLSVSSTSTAPKAQFFHC